VLKGIFHGHVRRSEPREQRIVNAAAQANEAGDREFFPARGAWIARLELQAQAAIAADLSLPDR